MKKILLSSALVAAIGALSFAPAVLAAPAPNTGTINISGKVVADSCVLAVNGNTNGTVQLPTVMTSALGTSGTTAGFTTFTLGLSGCDANATKATLSFSTGSNNDTTTHNLKNSNATGMATNVEVQLLNGSTSGSPQLKVDSDTVAINLASGSSTATTTLGAQYIANGGAAGAGLVSTAATVTFSYN